MSYYALDIFRRTGISMDNYILGILVQGGFTFGYVLSIPLLTHLPRRVQYCISGFTMAMCATGLAVGILRNDQVFDNNFGTSGFSLIDFAGPNANMRYRLCNRLWQWHWICDLCSTGRNLAYKHQGDLQLNPLEH